MRGSPLVRTRLLKHDRQVDSHPAAVKNYLDAFSERISPGRDVVVVLGSEQLVDHVRVLDINEHITSKAETD